MSGHMSAGNPRSSGFIRNPQDFWGGVVLVAFAGVAFWAGGDLQGIRGFQFGPGTAPRLFAGLLAIMGGIVAITGLIGDGPPVERHAARATLFGAILVILFLVLASLFGNVSSVARYNFVIASVIVDVLAFGIARFSFPGPVLVTAAILTFAGCIREVGLIVTSFATIMMAASASEEVRWIETTIWAALLTAFCVFLFRNALNLPLPLWPVFLPV